MTTYKLIRKTDHYAEIKALCDKHNLGTPDKFECAFGAFEDDVLVGIVFLQKFYMVEPLISSSPTQALVLGEKAMAIASLVDTEIYATVNKNNTKWNEVLGRFGFETIDPDMTLLRKKI